MKFCTCFFNSLFHWFLGFPRTKQGLSVWYRQVYTSSAFIKSRYPVLLPGYGSVWYRQKNLWDCLRRGLRRNLYLYFLHLQYWRSDWIYRKSALNYDDLTVSIQAAYYHWWKTIKCLNEKKQSLTILCRAKSLTKVKILWKRVKSCCSALALPHSRYFSWYLLWFVWTSAGNFQC